MPEDRPSRPAYPPLPDLPGDDLGELDQLRAEAGEDIVAVAQRLRCTACGEAPAGLPVVASTSPNLQ